MWMNYGSKFKEMMSTSTTPVSSATSAIKPEAEKEWQDWYREEFGLMEGEKKLRDSIEQQYEGKAAAQSAFAEQLTELRREVWKVEGGHGVGL